LPEPAATVRSITVYPLKSCRGISVPQAAITATGTILHSFCAVAMVYLLCHELCSVDHNCTH
jgi:hypothetical protein